MRYDHLPSDKHQIVHAHSRPFPATISLLSTSSAHPELGTDFPAPVQEQPDVIALLDFAGASGDVGPVVEDKGDEDVGGFDGFLHGQEFLPQLFPGLGLAEEGGFGHDFGDEGDIRIGSQALSGICCVAVGGRCYAGGLDRIWSGGPGG